MKTKVIIAILLFCVAVGAAVAGGFHGSHPDYKNNGKDSPRFYASPKGHPEHP